MTARSWASRTAKLARPAVVLSLPSPDSTSSTIAVEDNARQAPMMMAAGARSPDQTATLAMRSVERTICKPPRPKTRRRMAIRRS